MIHKTELKVDLLRFVSKVVVDQLSLGPKDAQVIDNWHFGPIYNLVLEVLICNRFF